MYDFDSILEQCLSQMAAGKARSQSCLLSYPALTEELAPLLQEAEELWALQPPALPPAAKARIERRLLEASKSGRRIDYVAHLSWRPLLIGFSGALVLFLLFGVMVSAAGAALPDSPLYSVKRTAEQVRLWLTPDHARPHLYLRLAQDHLNEFDALATKGLFYLSLVDTAVGELNAALTSVEDLATAQAIVVLEDISAQATRQQQDLSRWLNVVPGSQKAQLTAAIEASQEQASRAQALLGTLQPVQPPGQTKTPQPPGQTRTPQPPGQTMTPQPPGQTRTPQPPGQTKTPQPPGQTKTPQPPGQTKTPQPPGQSRTPQPPGQSRTPQPPGQSRTPQPPGQTRTPQPPGQTKSPQPPDQAKEPQPPGQVNTPEPPGRTKTPRPHEPVKKLP